MNTFNRCPNPLGNDEEETTTALNYSHIVHETDKAILLYIPSDKPAGTLNEFWFPFSQITMDFENSKVTVPVWIAKKHKLIP